MRGLHSGPHATTPGLTGFQDDIGLKTLVSGLTYDCGLALEFGEQVGVPQLDQVFLRLGNHPNPYI